MSLHNRLVTFVEELDLELSFEVKADTSLITSGLLDSLALVNLAVWIEQEIGIPMDATTFNLLEEWDTIGDILIFIEKHRGRDDS